MLGIGDPVPWFEAKTASGAETSVAPMAGRYLVLSFLGSAAREDVRGMLELLRSRSDIFEGTYAAFCGITTDAPSGAWSTIDGEPRKFAVLSDANARAADACGLVTKDDDGAPQLSKVSFILDPNLRVLAAIPFYDPVFHGREILTQLIEQLTIATTGAHLVQPPMLVVPRVFERDFCQRLIAAYRTGPARMAGEGDASALARRREFAIADDELQGAVRARFVRRLLPEIRKAFQFEATRIERYMIAGYDAAEGGAFLPHRDNWGAPFAHRRFAVTIPLNSEEYEGGNVKFLEYDGRGYRTPSGTAIVYSASLLHEVLPVTRGLRLAFVPFLYDEAGEKARQANLEGGGPGAI